jgi:hypothetical protein
VIFWGEILMGLKIAGVGTSTYKNIPINLESTDRYKTWISIANETSGTKCLKRYNLGAPETKELGITIPTMAMFRRRSKHIIDRAIANTSGPIGIIVVEAFSDQLVEP